LYYFARRETSHYLYKAIANGMGLDEFVSNGVTTEADNGQVRLIAGVDDDIPYGQCTPGLLEQAKSNLRNYFSVMGLTERFDESLLLMKKVLRWPSTPYYLKVNVTRSRPALETTSPEIIKKIEKDNQLDLEFYEWCQKEFEIALARYPEIAQDELGKFIEENKNYQKQMYIPGVLIPEAKKKIKKAVMPVLKLIDPSRR
jgi:hypothetical protein